MDRDDCAKHLIYCIVVDCGIRLRLSMNCFILYSRQMLFVQGDSVIEIVHVDLAKV